MHYWKVKPIRFNGLSTPPPTGNTFEFESKSHFDLWYKSHLAFLAELDEAMNYCAYFQRDKGNSGHYVREGKSFPVDGSWIGIQDFDNYPPCQPFVAWLNKNGWRHTWFQLMDKYKQHQGIALDIKPMLHINA